MSFRLAKLGSICARAVVMVSHWRKFFLVCRLRRVVPARCRQRHHVVWFTFVISERDWWILSSLDCNSRPGGGESSARRRRCSAVPLTEGELLRGCMGRTTKQSGDNSCCVSVHSSSSSLVMMVGKRRSWSAWHVRGEAASSALTEGTNAGHTQSR
jgi:hypothetical protein